MRKTLILHVGHYKTGTTALQVFLAQNRKKLLRRGVDYAEELLAHAKHSRLAFSIYRKAQVRTLMHGYRDPVAPEVAWGRIFDYAEASTVPQVVISSEEFMRMGAHPEAADILEAIIAPARVRFDFRVIAYLRSPGAHLRSWYNQLVKMNQLPPDFDTAVTRVMEPVHYDYALAVKPWVDVFGPEAVTLRPYLEGMRHDGGLLRDFLAQLGVDFDRAPAVSGWRLPQRDVNPRIDDRLLELRRALHAAGIAKDLQPWIEQRAGQMLPEQSVGTEDFAAVIARCRDGLEGLEALVPGSSAGMVGFAADLPRPAPGWQADLGRMMAVLLREQDVLRTRLYERNGELAAQLKAAEARLDVLERRLRSDDKG